MALEGSNRLEGGRPRETADPPITADMVFHAQQVVEKALKALLCWHDVPFRKTHNLVELGKQCAGYRVAMLEITGKLL